MKKVQFYMSRDPNAQFLGAYSDIPRLDAYFRGDDLEGLNLPCAGAFEDMTGVRIKGGQVYKITIEKVQASA